MSFDYTVLARFDDPAVGSEWIEWLTGGHCAEVLAAGATDARLIRHEGPDTVVEVRYGFPDRRAFEEYERRHAPRLRREGLERFPPERGISYRRTVGEIVHSAS